MYSLFMKFQKSVSLVTLGSLVVAKMPQDSVDLRKKFERLCKSAYDFNSAIKDANILQSDLDDLRKNLESFHDVVPKSLVDHQVRELSH